MSVGQTKKREMVVIEATSCYYKKERNSEVLLQMVSILEVLSRTLAVLRALSRPL